MTRQISFIKNAIVQAYYPNKAIIAAITLGLSNARIEATNNKIKLSIRMAYGFRNLDNLKAMITLRCGGFEVSLPGRAA